MDLNANRGGRPTQPTGNNQSGQHGNPASPASNPATGKPSGGNMFGAGDNKPSDKGKAKFLNMKFASIALLFSATILVVALLVYMVVGGPNKNEARYVENDAYQAVFLNGGQVYFGKTTDLNNKYLRLVDIYYLRVNQQVQPTEEGAGQLPQGDDISLVKLGCELHGPQDEMLINRDQVVFWENLKSDGDVTEAIATYKDENPDGQDCDEPQGAAGAGQQQTAPAGTDALDDTAPNGNEEGLDLDELDQ